MKAKFTFLFLVLSVTAFSQINWHLTNFGVPDSYNPVHMTQQTPSGDVFALCERNQSPGTLAKLLKSQDKGTHWTEVNMAGIPQMAPKWIQSAGSKLYIIGYVGSNAMLYQSTDNGLTWASIVTGFPSTHRLICMTYDPGTNTLYAGGLKGAAPNQVPLLAKSTDNGSTWVEIGQVSSSWGKVIVALGFSGGRLVMANHDLFSSSSNVVYSPDAGTTFSLSAGIGPSAITTDFTAKSNGELLLVTGYNNQALIYNSTDNGVNWNQVSASGASAITKPAGLLQTTGPLLTCGAGASTFTYYIYSSEPPAGLSESEGTSFKIFPNPAQTYLQIQAGPALFQTVTSVEIYSVDGRLISAPPALSNSIDIRELPQGTYYLKITTNTSSLVKSFIKN